VGLGNGKVDILVVATICWLLLRAPLTHPDFASLDHPLLLRKKEGEGGPNLNTPQANIIR